MPPTRRPLSSRDTRWAACISGWLARRGVRPNTISVASIFFAAAAGACLVGTAMARAAVVPWLWLAAAALIQLRLLCNLLDGMVAVEGGLKTKSGEIYNELPDRFADVFVLVAAGYASPQATGAMPWLGWLAAVFAVLTAYVRALGASAGAGQHFCGPMAKPHRMALMTATCVASAALAWLKVAAPLTMWALAIMVAGCVITIVRRTRRVIRELEVR